MANHERSPKRVILFIDTGDNCRCPMAHGYLLKLLEQRGIKHIEIRTAGVMTPTGLLPTPEAVQLLQEEGVDIRRHRSRPLSPDLIERADLVLGMTPFHVQTAFRMTEAARGKTYLLKEYVGREGKNTQIADPMGGTMEIFKKCFSEIRQCLQRLVEMEIVGQSPEIPDSQRAFISTPAVAYQEIEEKQKQLEPHVPIPHSEQRARPKTAPAPTARKEDKKRKPAARAAARTARPKPKGKAAKTVKRVKDAKPVRKTGKPAKPAKKAVKPAKPAKKAAKPAKPAKKAAKPAKAKAKRPASAKTSKKTKPAKKAKR